MPFQSEKQRRYLHANHPEIANRWEAKYGLGGIAELNAQLNDLPEYYIPAAQGGLIPSHEAGIYGLAEGGQLVKPGPGRPGYGGPHETAAAGKASTASSGGNGHHGNVAHGSGGRFETANTRTTPTKSQAPDQGGHSRFEPGSGYYGEPKTTPTTDDKGDGVYQDRIIKLADLKRKSDLKDIIAQGEKTETWEKAQKWNKPNKFMSFLGNAALAIIPGLLPAKMATAFRVGKLGYDIAYTDKYDATIEKFGFNKDEIISKVKSINNSKRDLYESLPDGHPEKIALSVELEIGKKTTPDGPNGEGGVKHPPTETAIKFEDIEEYNKKKMELASAEQIQVQKDVDRSKQMAYWRMMMEPYMSAQGGRVPGGYNTGGLSNLFRLKNT